LIELAHGLSTFILKQAIEPRDQREGAPVRRQEPLRAVQGNAVVEEIFALPVRAAVPMRPPS